MSKKGYACLLTMETRDNNCLFLIKQKLDRSVKLKYDANWLRFRLDDKQGILLIVNAVKGLIRNPYRILQLGEICAKYNIELKYLNSLTYNSAWFFGFLDSADSDGSVYLNLLSSQVFWDKPLQISKAE